jgi:hypothetical protein
MTESRRSLEALLDRAVPGFVYPGGRLSEAVVGQARLAGFAYALTTQSQLNQRPVDPMCLGRIGMPDSSAADFRRSLHDQVRRLPAAGSAPAPARVRPAARAPEVEAEITAPASLQEQRAYG